MCVHILYIWSRECDWNGWLCSRSRAQADPKQKMSKFVIYYPNPVSVSDSFGCLASAGGGFAIVLCHTLRVNLWPSLFMCVSVCTCVRVCAVPW